MEVLWRDMIGISSHLFRSMERRMNVFNHFIFDRYSIDTTHFTQDGNQVIVTGNRNFFKVYDMIEGKIMQIPMMKGKSISND